MYSQVSHVQEQQLEANLFYLRLGIEILTQEIKELFNTELYRLLNPQKKEPLETQESVPEESPLEELVGAA